MKLLLQFVVLIATVYSSSLLTGCMSQEARTERVTRRQDRIDERTSARQERWRIRGEREDARARNQIESW